MKPFWQSLYNEKFKAEKELSAFQRNCDRMCQGATGYTITLNVDGAIDIFQLDFFDNCETLQEKELMSLMKKNFEEW